jgi:gliding motility-associated-like protein
VITPDVVNLVQSGTFSQSTVGTGIAITSTSTIDNANYSLTQPALTARDITPKALTVTGATTTNKPYDRTNTASVTGGTLVGVITPDVVNLVQSGTFSQSTVGTGIAITSTSTIDNANYSLTQPSLTARDITPKALTVTGLTTSNKEYDRTNIATLTGGSLNGVISPDVVNFTASGTFSQSTVGTGIAITSTSTIDNANYSLTQPTLTARDITPKALTVTGVTTSNKVYDRTNTANVTGGTLLGVISPDLVNLTQSGTFAQVNVGTGIAITSTSTIDNTNYRLTQPTLIARDITAKPLKVTATPGQTKVFGAVDPPNFTYTLSAPLLGSDVLNGALKRDAGEAIGSYAINQGTLTNLNYDITFVGNNFVITPAPANITGTTKAYDLPNAFTPNGDGKNDEFKIIVNDPTRVNLISFQIYNRNGILMFSTNKISEGWDGRYKGVMQDMGIYFVKLITSEKGMDKPTPIYLLK